MERSEVIEVQAAALARILAVRNTRLVHQMNPEESAEVGHIVLEEHMDRRGRWAIGQYCLFLKDHKDVVREQCSRELVVGFERALTGQDGKHFAEMLAALEGFTGFRWSSRGDLEADQSVPPI